MKYGLLVFKETDNIGDDIQAYAAERFLPKVDYYIDRESLNVFMPNNQERVAMIMNAWYMYNKFTLPPSPYIEPLFVSVHFSKSDFFQIEDDCLDASVKNYFNQFGKVGCRDNSTRRILENKGIETYFSGCLTLTIEPQAKISKENIIYCVDVSEEIVKKVEKLNVSCHIKKKTHDIEPKKSGFCWSDRKRRVENLLVEYQSARCVITTRLHCALPCLALGTPVLLVYREEDYFKNRMKDFLPFLHYCSEEDFLEDRVNYDVNNPPLNSNEFDNLKNQLKEQVKEFIEVNNEKNDEVNLSEEYWYNQLRWQSDLLKRQLPKMKKLHNEAWERKQMLKKEEWQEKEIEWLNNKIVGTEKYYKQRELWMKEKLEVESKEKESVLNEYIRIKNSITYKVGKVILYIPKGSRAAYEAVAPWNQMDIYDVLEPPTGIENTEITAIGIYPNPVVNTISISVQDAAIIKSIKIIDLAGTVVKNLHPEGTLTFDVSDLVNGMYFLQLNDDTTVKFIKK